MAKPRLTDAQIAALPKERRERTLKRRRERERSRAKAGLVQTSNVRKVDFALPADPAPAAVGEVIYGLDPDDHRARAIYCHFRTKLQEAGRWGGETTHGMLLIYVKASLEGERQPLGMVSGHVLTAQHRAAVYLKLSDLPADKVRKTSDRFEGDWK